MKKAMMVVGFATLVCLLAVWPTRARAQGMLENVTGTAFDHAVPADFYLEGNHIPVEKRNAVLLKNAQGARVVLGLIDTTGYSSQIKQKYIGMLITETKLSVCGNALGVGSYGFGLERPAATSNADAPFKIYNQAGEKVGECAAKKDDSLKQPKPLAVTAAKDGSAKLCLGKYVVEIK
ncbi:MAG: hypothetical protein WAO35_16050 [Terriglobia bacterium]